MNSETHDVKTALAAIPLLQGIDLTGLNIHRLPGLSNRNYRVRSAGVDYVLRLPGVGSERYIDRAGEIHNRRQAVQLGLAPELLYADPGSGVQLSMYLPGRSLQPSDLQDNAQLQAAITVLGRLHRSKAEFQGAWPLFDTLADYLRWADPRWRAELAVLQTEIQRLRPELEDQAQPLCACHCDPTPANFYRQPAGRLWLLDWEYSAMAEPAWDLATLAAEAELDSQQRVRLVYLYAGHDDAGLLRRIEVYLACLHTLAAAWAAAQVNSGNQQESDLASTIRCRRSLAWSQFKSLRYPSAARMMRRA